jgi:hypothetical protein
MNSFINRLLEAHKTKTLNEIDRLGTEAARAREDTSKPFPQAGQLAAARDRARQINLGSAVNWLPGPRSGENAQVSSLCGAQNRENA